MPGIAAGQASDHLDDSVADKLHQFQRLQATRVHTSCRLQAAFKALLDTKQEGSYRATMAELTATFSRLSEDVISLENGFRASGNADFAALLRRVQEGEREKLRMTLTLQALRLPYYEQRFSWQHSDAGLAQPSERGAVGDALVHACSPAEPTQEEYEGAVAEATQSLQAAIVSINDALEEVQYALTDEVA